MLTRGVEASGALLVLGGRDESLDALDHGGRFGAKETAVGAAGQGEDFAHGRKGQEVFDSPLAAVELSGVAVALGVVPIAFEGDVDEQGLGGFVVERLQHLLGIVFVEMLDDVAGDNEIVGIDARRQFSNVADGDG